MLSLDSYVVAKVDYIVHKKKLATTLNEPMNENL